MSVPPHDVLRRHYDIVLVSGILHLGVAEDADLSFASSHAGVRSTRFTSPSMMIGTSFAREFRIRYSLVSGILDPLRRFRRFGCSAGVPSGTNPLDLIHSCLSSEKTQPFDGRL